MGRSRGPRTHLGTLSWTNLTDDTVEKSPTCPTRERDRSPSHLNVFLPEKESGDSNCQFVEMWCVGLGFVLRKKTSKTTLLCTVSPIWEQNPTLSLSTQSLDNCSEVQKTSVTLGNWSCRLWDFEPAVDSCTQSTSHRSPPDGNDMAVPIHLNAKTSYILHNSIPSGYCRTQSGENLWSTRHCRCRKHISAVPTNRDYAFKSTSRSRNEMKLSTRTEIFTKQHYNKTSGGRFYQKDFPHEKRTIARR